MTVRFSLLLWERGEWADTEEERWVLIGSNAQKMGSPILPCQKMRVGSCCLLFREKKRFLSFGIVPEIQKNGDPARTRIGTQDSEKRGWKKRQKIHIRNWVRGELGRKGEEEEQEHFKSGSLGVKYGLSPSPFPAQPPSIHCSCEKMRICRFFVL